MAKNTFLLVFWLNAHWNCCNFITCWHTQMKLCLCKNKLCFPIISSMNPTLLMAVGPHARWAKLAGLLPTGPGLFLCVHVTRTHPLLVTRGEWKKEKKRREITLGKILNPCRLLEGTTRNLFAESFSALPPIHTPPLWTTQKEKTRHFVLLSIPVLTPSARWRTHLNGGRSPAEQFFHWVGKKNKKPKGVPREPLL